MPVNMDPNKRRGAKKTSEKATPEESGEKASRPFGELTEEDREKDEADAEWKNLWDATEVIDMDKW